MPSVRHKRLAGLAACVALLASGLSGVSEARPTRPAAEPTIGSVSQRLEQLSRSAEQLSERYNAANIALARAERRLAQARLTADRATQRYDRDRTEFARWVVQRYQQGASGSMTALLTSRDKAQYLDQLSINDLLGKVQAEQLARMEQSTQQAARSRETARQALTSAAKHRIALSTSRQKVIAETKRYKRLLATLNARQRAAYSARTTGTVTKTNVKVRAGSAAAQRAVNFALAQVGKPYVFGAAGPDSYDCSGLTMAAWQQGGVSLPHLASSQYNYGRRVGADELEPGDLVFLYDDLSHVSMYIGNGLLVSAPQPGENVKIVPFEYFRSDFVGGSRLA